MLEIRELIYGGTAIAFEEYECYDGNGTVAVIRSWYVIWQTNINQIIFKSCGRVEWELK